MTVTSTVTAADEEFAREAHLRLANGAAKIRDVSASIDQHIKHIENWLASLPGRVDTQVVVPDPVFPEFFDFYLLLRRPAWRLQCARKPNKSSHKEIEWELLSSASLEAKMCAIDAIPVLLKEMNKSQGQLLAKLSQAESKYRRFIATTVKVKEGM